MAELQEDGSTDSFRDLAKLVNKELRAAGYTADAIRRKYRPHAYREKLEGRGHGGRTHTPSWEWSAQDANIFAAELAAAVATDGDRPQVSTDGFEPYVTSASRLTAPCSSRAISEKGWTRAAVFAARDNSHGEAGYVGLPG